MTPSVMVPRDGAATGELAGIAEQVEQGLAHLCEICNNGPQVPGAASL